jgi:co-chaperonin GroES (HSP10)
MKPLYDWVLAKKIENESVVITGADIEDSPQKFEVLAVGPGKYESGKFAEVPPEIKPGAIVWLQKHASADTPDELKAKGEYLFMASRIIGVES